MCWFHFDMLVPYTSGGGTATVASGEIRPAALGSRERQDWSDFASRDFVRDGLRWPKDDIVNPWTKRIEMRMSDAVPAPKRRRSARVILLSPAGEVLLISFRVPRSDGEFAFWATPGGEVEEGEEYVAAAQRELREELELTVELQGPVHLSEVEFEHNGVLTRSTDVFFLGKCEREAPRLRPFTQEERAVIQSSRWWTLDEIDTTPENVFPEALSAIVAPFLE